MQVGVSRRTRVFAVAVLGLAVFTATFVIEKGLHHESVVSVPKLPGLDFSDVPAPDLSVETAHGGTLLAALATAGRVGASVVTVDTGHGAGAGFVGWADANHSYVPTARPVVGALLAGHHRNLQIVAGDTVYAGRLIASSPARQLALIRVRGHIGSPVLRRRPGGLTPGRVAVNVSVTTHRRVEPVTLRLTPNGNLRALGKQRLFLGTPVLLLNGHPGGIVVRAGRDAVVFPLEHCRTRQACFGPTLP